MNDMLSQQEINALLRGTIDFEDTTINQLTVEEKDALGEIGNISMGTSATTLFSLLGHKVTITTPNVSIVTWEQLEIQYPMPYVAVEVHYEEGLEGLNLLALKEDDVKSITSLMMGGSGTVDGEPLNELHLSAISEAMNQMVGSSSTSLSQMFNKKINISPPRAFLIDFSSPIIKETYFNNADSIIKVSFRMEVENIIDSEIMQLYPLSFGKMLVSSLYSQATSQPVETKEIKKSNSTQKTASEVRNIATHSNNVEMPSINTEYSSPSVNNIVNQVSVQPVQFQSFENNQVTAHNENIDIIIDVPLNITVELGRTKKSIKEILEFGPGTVIELDKLAGEPLDILVNGKYIAKGEVVVIDESFGIRITEIIHPSKRISKV